MGLPIVTQHNIKYDAVISTPIGQCGIKINEDKVSELHFLSAEEKSFITNAAQHVTQQIEQYFLRASHQFTLPCSAAGTPFQQRVWKALCDIPAGTTLTYGALAKKLNSSPRAVGQACRRNPIPVIIPCHRVTGAKGLGGYAGETTGKLFLIKQLLLKHEGSSSLRSH